MGALLLGRDDRRAGRSGRARPARRGGRARRARPARPGARPRRCPGRARQVDRRARQARDQGPGPGPGGALVRGGRTGARAPLARAARRPRRGPRLRARDHPPPHGRGDQEPEARALARRLPGRSLDGRARRAHRPRARGPGCVQGPAGLPATGHRRPASLGRRGPEQVPRAARDRGGRTSDPRAARGHDRGGGARLHPRTRRPLQPRRLGLAQGPLPHRDLLRAREPAGRDGYGRGAPRASGALVRPGPLPGSSGPRAHRARGRGPRVRGRRLLVGGRLPGRRHDDLALLLRHDRGPGPRHRARADPPLRRRALPRHACLAGRGQGGLDRRQLRQRLRRDLRRGPHLLRHGRVGLDQGLRRRREAARADRGRARGLPRQLRRGLRALRLPQAVAGAGRELPLRAEARGLHEGAGAAQGRPARVVRGELRRRRGRPTRRLPGLRQGLRDLPGGLLLGRPGALDRALRAGHRDGRRPLGLRRADLDLVAQPGRALLGPGPRLARRGPVPRARQAGRGGPGLPVGLDRGRAHAPAPREAGRRARRDRRRRGRVGPAQRLAPALRAPAGGGRRAGPTADEAGQDRRAAGGPERRARGPGRGRPRARRRGHRRRPQPPRGLPRERAPRARRTGARQGPPAPLGRVPAPPGPGRLDGVRPDRLRGAPRRGLLVRRARRRPARGPLQAARRHGPARPPRAPAPRLHADGG